MAVCDVTIFLSHSAIRVFCSTICCFECLNLLFICSTVLLFSNWNLFVLLLLILFSVLSNHSLKKSVSPMRCWPTLKRRNFMIAMENKACGKEAGVAQEWTTSSPTSLAVDSLASWVRGVALGMEAGGEERTWSIHSSKTKLWHKLFACGAGP